MGHATIVWAGKQLSGLEEARLRRLVHAFRRTGNDEMADDFERFLPEREQVWTDAERSVGARVGGSLTVSGRIDGEYGIRLDDTA